MAKSQKDRLAFSRNEVKRSKKWRSKDGGMAHDDAWRRFISLYSGKHWSSDSGTDQLVVNMIFSTINVLGPAVAVNNPRFIVDAQKPENSPQAIIVEEVLNHQWRIGGFQREFRLGILDWLLIGHGWLKVGWKATKEPEEKKAKDLSSSDVDMASEGAMDGIDDREEGSNTESEMHTVGDRPFVERISPFEVYVDPDARHPKEMRWIAQRTWRSVADVHVDSRYSATHRTKVSGSHYSRWGTDDGDARAVGDGGYTTDQPDAGAVQYAQIIEFYDLKRNTVGTFAMENEGDGDGGWLIKPEKIPYGFGHPFVMIRNHEVPDHFYPIGDVEMIEPLQLELNETRTQMLNYRKKFRRAWMYANDRFDKDGVAALESEEDNVMIPVMGDQDPESALRQVPAGIVPAEFFNQSEMIQNDLDQVSGVSDYARGNPQQNIRRTATEASMIQDSSNARAADRLTQVEDVLSEVAERVVGVMQQYMTGEQVARIVTIPVKGWINFDSDYIQGRFDFTVRGGSTEPRNEMQRRQSAMQLVDAAMPFLEMGVADPGALWMKILRDGFGEKDAQRYIAQPSPGPDMGGGPPPDEGMPPDEGGMMPPPSQDPTMGGMIPPVMDPGMAAEAGPPPGTEVLTPEILAAMIAQERGIAPEQGLPPEMLAGIPPMP